MRHTTKESLTHHDEAHDVPDRVGGKILKLEATKMKEAPKGKGGWGNQDHERGGGANIPTHSLLHEAGGRDKPGAAIPSD